MPRYTTVLLVEGDKLVRPCGSDYVLPCDGRLSDLNAINKAEANHAGGIAFHGYAGKPYIIVLFLCAKLSGDWAYLRQLPCNGASTARAEDIERALNN